MVRLAFRGNGRLTPDQEEIRNLKAQVKRPDVSITGCMSIMKDIFIDHLNHTYLTVSRQPFPRPLTTAALYSSRIG
jgi:hypothetical protein